MSLLGPVRVDTAQQVTGVSAAKPRLLLTLLALQSPHTASVDSLIDGMWGEEPPSSARKALQVHISALRRLLGEESIITENAGYRLDADVDVARFEEIIEAAVGRLEDEPEKAVARLETALDLWQDVPFADLPDEPSLIPERVRLTELRLGAVERRLDVLIQLGRHHEVLGDLERLTADHPYRERLRALQMRALYRSGRQAEALRAFQETRRRLADDLGIEPTSELRDLEQRILEQDPALGRSETQLRPYSTLPARRSDLVGRNSDVATVLGLLDESPLVTLTGVGGCGKTRLAIEVAHRAAGQFPGGVFFVDLTRISDDDAVLLAVIGGIGIEVRSSTTAEDLVSFLRLRTALLVLDNCEHVLDGVAGVVDLLLDGCPDLTLLATSREAISVNGEVAWRVPSLDVRGPESAAVQLFIRRAREASGSFDLHDHDYPEVLEICSRLDGLPLAIELAAARTQTMTVGEIRQRLDDRFRLLAGGRRRASQRQQTLQGAVEWSYGLLSDDEKTILRRLSVFQGGFDLADVPSVLGFDPADAVDLVDTLVSKSLVDVVWEQGSITRRRLLETIRLFALDRLISDDDGVAARDRHFDVFATDLSDKSMWEIETNREIRERVDRELDNFVAAIDWGQETGKERQAALLAGRISGALFWTGLLPKYRDLLEADYGLEPHEEAILLFGQASLLHSTDDRADESKRLSQRARSVESVALIPDLVFSQLTEFDFAPVQGAAERLAALDEMLADADTSTPEVYLAEIEIRRAGQLFSLARVEDALEASRRTFDWVLAGGTTAVYWAATATIALLVVCERREEAVEVLAVMREEGESGRLAGFVDAPILEILTALSRVGAGDPTRAGKDLAESARQHMAGRGPLQEGDYLALFAAFRAEIGDADRAEELMEFALVKNGHINWLVWPYVWNWEKDEFEKQNEERRLWELARMERATELRPHIPRYLTEEIDFWTSRFLN